MGHEQIDYNSGNERVVNVYKKYFLSSKTHEIPMKTTTTKYLFTTFLLLFALRDVAHAQTLTRGAAWLWSDQASPTGTITPNTAYSYNSAGGAITMFKLRTGVYEVNFAGLNLPANTSLGLHISAYGGNHHCINHGAAPGTNTYRWQIRCFAPDGTAKDGLFTAIIFKDDRQDGNNVTMQYVPSAATSVTITSGYNSRGGAIKVDKFSVGLYRVEALGIKEFSGTLMVTAFNQTEARYCSADSWAAAAGNVGIHLFVRCFDKDGKEADSPVQISYRNDLQVGVATKGAAFHNATFHADGTTPVPTVSPFYSSKNTASSTATTITRSSVGNYRVELAGIAPANQTTAIVKSLGDKNTYCNINSFFDSGKGGTGVQVWCFNNLGLPTDARFALQYFTNVANGTLTSATTEAPTGFELSEAYPNPFNPSTSFTLSLAKSQNIAIKVFNILGQEMATLHNGVLSANTKHAFSFEAKGLTSGTYFVQAIGEDFSQTRMAMLLK